MMKIVSWGKGHGGRRKQLSAEAAENDSMHVASKRWRGRWSSNKKVSACSVDSRVWVSQKISKKVSQHCDCLSSWCLSKGKTVWLPVSKASLLSCFLTSWSFLRAVAFLNCVFNQGTSFWLYALLSGALRDTFHRWYVPSLRTFAFEDLTLWEIGTMWTLVCQGSGEQPPPTPPPTLPAPTC